MTLEVLRLAREARLSSESVDGGTEARDWEEDGESTSPGTFGIDVGRDALARYRMMTRQGHGEWRDRCWSKLGSTSSNAGDHRAMSKATERR